jgi:hypothetical protein|tara:strand:- start:1236 stop:1421 length:186 start_codon:yes stop_codon:yes gene_type:complete
MKKGNIMKINMTLEEIYTQFKLAKTPQEKIKLLKFVRDTSFPNTYKINFDNVIKQLELQIN